MGGNYTGVDNWSEQVRQFEQALTPAVYQAAWRYACHLCRTRDDAEDLLQESLAAALPAWPQLKHPDSFRAWLFSILRHTHLMQLRSARRGILARTQGTDGLDERLADLTPAPGANPQTAQVIAALKRLPAAQYELVCLFYFEDLSLRETAQVMQLTPGAVMQRLHRARARLKVLCGVDCPPAAAACPTRGDTCG